MKNNLVIYQGSDFGMRIRCLQTNRLTPISLAGYTFLAQIREFPESDVISASFAVAFEGDPSLGAILLTLTADETDLLINDKYSWDIFGTSGDTTIRIAGGDVKVVPKISKTPEEVAP